MNKSYLITLTPTGKFFFGGDMTFKVGNEEKFSSYIIFSNRFPQQTSLLGMLRFLVLRNSGKEVFYNDTIEDKDKAIKLIGPKSFTFEELNSEKSFGAIKSITPCFLMEGEKAIPLATKASKFTFSEEGCTSSIINGKEVRMPNFEFNPKTDFSDSYSPYFKTDMRMGIDKEYDGKKRDVKDKEEHLYKQCNYRFANEDMKFAFYACVDSSVNLSDYDRQLVSLGADSSFFIINIKEQQFDEIQVSADNLTNCVVLTSPSYIQESDLDDVDYAVSDIIPFRFMNTDVKGTKSYNKIKREISHSDKIYLYEPGSVFFFPDEGKCKVFAERIESYKAFRQIGYNYCITK